MQFTKLLMQWNQKSNGRKMPWKGEKDPYKIWLSEIILQQTRVEQGWDYYEKFLQHFPTIQDLAKADDKKVMKLWEGLGYYNRCKNLLITARTIVEYFQGKFPTNYETILSLKGIGPYTAAAIGSFAFNLPYAVVDGNVYRVLSRYYGIETPIDTKEGVAVFNAIANQNLDRKQPGQYNQAIMDFGATVCKPIIAACSNCPLQKTCKANLENKVSLLPIKLKSLTRKTRHFVFYVFEFNKSYWVQQRVGKDIWQGLYQFYLQELQGANSFTTENALDFIEHQLDIKKTSIFLNELQCIKGYKQQLTHQTIHAQFVKIKFKHKPIHLETKNFKKLLELKKLAFPKIINDFLNKEIKK